MSRNITVRCGWRTVGSVLVVAGALATPIRAHADPPPRDRQAKTPARSTIVSTDTTTSTALSSIANTRNPGMENPTTPALPSPTGASLTS